MRRVQGLVLSLAAIAATTAIYYLWLRVNETTVALTYVVLILIVAARYGLMESVAASLGATLCLNYFFIPPILTFTINDPKNWIASFAFFAASLIASQLAIRARQRAADAERSRDEMERLYALSRGILQNPGSAGPAPIARQLALVLDCASVALYDRVTNTLHHAGETESPIAENTMRDSAITGRFLTEGETMILPLQLRDKTIGSVALTSPAVTGPALESAVSLVSIALEQQQAQSAASRAEVARRSEEMKSTLLDALAHEFKTPLTSIKAAATARIDSAPPRDRELWTIVNEEADRLNRLVVETIEVSRLEAGRIEMHKTLTSVEAVAQELIRSKARALEGRDLQLTVAPDLPLAVLDAVMIEKAMEQLLENALKYSPPGSPIEVRLSREDCRVVVTIADHGSGVEPGEQEEIFDKFYRGARHRGQVPGTGMGLAIAREIVQAHGGCLWVESSPGQGSAFSFNLPADAEARP